MAMSVNVETMEKKKSEKACHSPSQTFTSVAPERDLLGGFLGSFSSSDLGVWGFFFFFFFFPQNLLFGLVSVSLGRCFVLSSCVVDGACRDHVYGACDGVG